MCGILGARPGSRISAADTYRRRRHEVKNHDDDAYDYNDFKRMSKNTNAGDSSDHEQFWCTKDAVPSFSGQDKTYPVSKWIQDIEVNGDIFQWSPIQQLLVARRSLTGTAALWFRAEKTFKTWEELKTAISKEFPDTLDQKTVHELMSARKKKPSESLLEYLYTMKELGKRGKMPDYIAIRYIVDGIPDLESNKIMLYGVTTYSDLKDKLKIYEMVKEKMKVRMLSTRSKQQAEAVRHSDHYKPFQPRCFSCGDRSHMLDQCPHSGKGKKCFHCNDFGHISAECQSKKHANATPSTSRTYTYTQSRKDGGGAERTTRTIERNEYQRSRSMPHEATPPKQTYFTTNECGAIDDVMHDVHVVNTDMKCATIHERNATYDSDSSNRSIDVIDQDVKDNNNIALFTSRSRQKPLKTVKICGKTAEALVDSGSDINLITDEWRRQLGLSVNSDSVS
ncbi:hypothetical protein HW555_005008, partial [Spodoptera exigua]